MISKNPFINDGLQDSESSSNRVKIDDIPGLIIEDEVKGKLARDILSIDIVIDLIKKNLVNLGLNNDINDKDLPRYLAKCLQSNDILVKEASNKIIKRIGRNLGYILLILKHSHPISRSSRPDWNNTHWDYWQSIDNVMLAGGLCSGVLGENIKKYAIEVFDENNIKPYNITISDNPSISSIIGAARLITHEKYALTFDFGHTSVKRGLIGYNETLEKVYILKSVPSNYSKWKYESEDEKNIEANKLSQYMIKVILDSIKEVEEKGYYVGNTISISIANYIKNGVLNPSGGYSKLNTISNNYEKYLSQTLSNILDKNIKVIFVHDGMAAALEFSEVKNSVVLTLGTAIGTGFTNQNKDVVNISKNLIIEEF